MEKNYEENASFKTLYTKNTTSFNIHKIIGFNIIDVVEE